MKRKAAVGRDTKKRSERATRRLTDRRGFLTGAGKYGALLVGAAYMPVAAGQGSQGQQLAADGDSMPVEQKGLIRILGAVQRRPGQTKVEARFADTPHIVPSYYSAVYQELTKKAPGRNRASVLNVVTDAAFGGDGGVPPVSTNLHIQQAPQQIPCTVFVNRDLVSEVSCARVKRSSALSSRGRATNAVAFSAGRGNSFRTAAVMMPSVPSEPINRSRRS